MNSQEFHQEESVCRDPFIAVIVYEDTNALQRTLPTFQRLMQEFGTETDFKCIWVSFDNLTNQMVANDAAANAIRADIVIFSAHSNELPTYIREWVENWLPCKNLNDSLLVALIECVESCSGTTPAHRYLKNAAARGSMNFLSEIKKTTPSLSAIPLAINRSIVPNHWGINE